MGIYGARADLLKAGDKLNDTFAGLADCKDAYTLGTSKLGEVLPFLQGVVPKLLKSALEDYERGMNALRGASSAYQEKVLPPLSESGLAQLDSPAAQQIITDVTKAGGSIESASQQVLQDLLRDEIFEAATADVKELAAGMLGVKNGIESGVLSDDAPLPLMLEAIDDCKQAVIGYAKVLDS